MDWESCEDEAIEDWEEDGMEEGEKVDMGTWEGEERESEGVRGGKVRRASSMDTTNRVKESASTSDPAERELVQLIC